MSTEDCSKGDGASLGDGSSVLPFMESARGQVTPSTTLRVVPLPRVPQGRIRDSAAAYPPLRPKGAQKDARLSTGYDGGGGEINQTVRKLGGLIRGPELQPSLIYAPRAGHALFNAGRTCPMLGQDRDNNIARVEQDGFLLVRRDLDEAQPSEQENSFNGQQCVTDFLNLAAFRSKRIEQSPVIPSHWLQHFRGMHQRCHKKSRLAGRGVVLIERFLDVGQDHLQRVKRHVTEPLAHRVLKARHFSLQRRANQPVLGREGVNETTLAILRKVASTATRARKDSVRRAQGRFGALHHSPPSLACRPAHN